MEIILTSLAALAVGLAIGWTSVAGFLLPILFINYNRLGSAGSLFLAFLCFLAGGVLASTRYHRQGLLDAHSLLFLSLFSLAGATAGAVLNSAFDEWTMKMVLYAVVLASGTSILVRDALSRKKGEGNDGGQWSASRPMQAATGFATALLCALSGAGGPVLLMPLLILQKMDAKKAVAAALFNSVFIALPSIVVYGARSETFRWSLIIPVVLAHGLGILFASSHNRGINAAMLKRGIAIFSIIFALAMVIINWR